MQLTQTGSVITWLQARVTGGFEHRRKVKVVQRIEYVKRKADMSRKFGLVNWTIEMVWEDETTVMMHLNRTDREEGDSKAGIQQR